MSGFVAIFDACVLHPAPLRDLLVRLAITGLFRARWTEQIHQEWMRSLRARRPDLADAQLERTRRLMDEAVRDCLVKGYEALIDSLRLPDANDHHVLAAAIACQAGVIVTYNTKHFPSAVMAPLGIEVEHPDDFIVHLFDLAPAAVCAAVRDQRQALKKPERTVRELLDTFLSLELAGTVAALEQMQELL
jgi:hypothetical protein